MSATNDNEKIDKAVRLSRSATRLLEKIGRMDLMDDRNFRVYASTQYGMGFILTGDNRILFRDDSLSHEDRMIVASLVNQLISSNRQPP